MANSFYSSQHTTAAGAANSISTQFEIALVHKVFLSYDDITREIDEVDSLYDEYTEKTDYITKSARHYGSIKYRMIGAGSETNEETLPIALPYNRNLLSLPVVGELVKIYKSLAGTDDYYDKLSPEVSPNYSTDIALSLAGNKVTSENTSKQGGEAADQYGETNSVGISQSNKNIGSTDTLKRGFAGKYFKRNMKIHPLALNEGDTILQGRFGNSIRFSGYIHDDKDNGAQFPAILIRNGESADNQGKKIYDVVSEDINNDGTSIQITSGKYKTLYDSTTIKVNKEANSKYPSSDQLIGDQIVFNSGRVIISSKTAETFLFSKKTFSIFTDDMVTIDSEKGLNFTSHNGNITFKAKSNKNIFLDSSRGGNIFIGKNTGVGDAGADVQRMVMGGELVQLLTQLIDAITQQSYATPVGPTATGPVNVATFNALKNRIKNILSARNYLSKS